jgi:hypothetical protein
MDDSSDEEEDVAESSQSNEEQVIRALMKKLPKEQLICLSIWNRIFNSGMFDSG